MAQAEIRSNRVIRTDAGATVIQVAVEAHVAIQTVVKYELDPDSVRLDKRRQLDATYARLAVLRAA